MNTSEHQKERQRRYLEMVQRLTPQSEMKKSLLRSFWVGGVICMLGQGFHDLGVMLLELSEKDASGFASVCMILLGALLTGLGVYDRIGHYAGAGSIVPITGFANSIVSSAMEYRREGLILGVGSRLFQIAGPVLVYGIGSSVIAGIIAYFLGV